MQSHDGYIVLGIRIDIPNGQQPKQNIEIFKLDSKGTIECGNNKIYSHNIEKCIFIGKNGEKYQIKEF